MRAGLLAAIVEKGGQLNAVGLSLGDVEQAGQLNARKVSGYVEQSGGLYGVRLAGDVESAGRLHTFHLAFTDIKQPGRLGADRIAVYLVGHTGYLQPLDVLGDFVHQAAYFQSFHPAVLSPEKVDRYVVGQLLAFLQVRAHG